MYQMSKLNLWSPLHCRLTNFFRVFWIIVIRFPVCPIVDIFFDFGSMQFIRFWSGRSLGCGGTGFPLDASELVRIMKNLLAKARKSTLIANRSWTPSGVNGGEPPLQVSTEAVTPERGGWVGKVGKELDAEPAAGSGIDPLPPLSGFGFFSVIEKTFKASMISFISSSMFSHCLGLLSSIRIPLFVFLALIFPASAQSASFSTKFVFVDQRCVLKRRFEIMTSLEVGRHKGKQSLLSSEEVNIKQQNRGYISMLMTPAWAGN